MLKKRLVGVVTIKNNWAVQSFDYERYLPLGKPECLVENLDRWGVDEIMIQLIDRSATQMGPHLKLLKQLSSLGLSTPLIYAGGIRSVADGIQVIQSGADRLVIDTLLWENPQEVAALATQLGAQAIIASMPVMLQNQALHWLNYRNRSLHLLGEPLLALFQAQLISEVLLIDYQHEGQPQGFEASLVNHFPLKEVPIIAFGGLSEPTQMGQLLNHPQISALAVGNFLSYREHAVQQYKEILDHVHLRAPSYDARYSIHAHP